jgi:hypothetical protein
MYRVNIERAHDARIFTIQSDFIQTRDRVVFLEKERDAWRAKEETLRNDLHFLKEVNIKSHEITR